MKAVALIVLLAVLRLLLVAWVFMIGIGVIHAEWLGELPTIGYAASVGVSTMLLVLVAVFAPSTIKED